MAAIETNGLTKRYGSETALESLDLDVAEGEVFGFLGPNGAGKTTTIDLLLDFIRPTEGSATVLGYDAHEEPGEVRERVGILPDGFDLWERSSGYSHLEFAIESKGNGEDPDELLDRVGLDRADAERNVGGYSKGMLQRLAMAIALVGDPEVLILDEPSSGLDPHGIRQMQEIVLEEARSGTTVFFSSHILGQVSSVCDRIGILDDGELVTVDSIEGLRETAGIGSRLLLDVDEPAAVNAAALQDLDGVTDLSFENDSLQVNYATDAAKARIIHRVVESETAVRDFETEEATLEDLFDAFTETDAEAVKEARRVADGDGTASDSETPPADDTADSGDPTVKTGDPAIVEDGGGR